MSSADDLDAVIVSAYPGLLAYARLLTRSPGRAEDIVHEALVRCLRRSRRAEIRKFVPYARRAIVNEVIRSARRRGEPKSDVPCAAYPQDVVIEQELLRGWLTRLTPRQRVAVVSRYYLDLSEIDTAELMGCSLPAVKSLCHRGLAQLRSAAGAEAAVRRTQWARAGLEDR